ncbi:MAG: bifunctional precorrin-2 dehydrogenase/sirohydrochlorin ferrochelatase [Candidatus Omnitrophica bacterium]|nr:bifunctional precorrin-2 dehydrogenase/sirohydrochlorin ferrochelatase [Candidatus Omnitrophota bacterium]
MMKYYPIFLNVRGKKCCIVGAGAVALRKAKTLICCGADVYVISPSICKGFLPLKKLKLIKHVKSEYKKRYIKNAELVIAATDNRTVNAQIAKEANKQRILVNVVDMPLESSFIAPSYINKGSLIIAISTSGMAPILAKKIRQDLEKNFLPKYQSILKDVSTLREQLKKRLNNALKRKKKINQLVNQYFLRNKNKE